MTKAIEDLQSKLTTFDLNLPERIDEGEKVGEKHFLVQAHKTAYFEAYFLKNSLVVAAKEIRVRGTS